ncbi:MAG: putative Serine/threonine-protein kinase ATM [Streblomastix strix]|uniref:non-specific serine/threonine protein kinase n=1 Tax=Streblomastix strix TaxID=222440 RepID=A0A5J4X0Q4_9EUKA|nr:MAG: putative Serine/threonine-protein kinase ATM [Streblomastix strix]
MNFFRKFNYYEGSRCPLGIQLIALTKRLRHSNSQNLFIRGASAVGQLKFFLDLLENSNAIQQQPQQQKNSLALGGVHHWANQLMHVAFRILLPDTLDDGVERTNESCCEASFPLNKILNNEFQNFNENIGRDEKYAKKIDQKNASNTSESSGEITELLSTSDAVYNVAANNELLNEQNQHASNSSTPQPYMSFGSQSTPLRPRSQISLSSPTKGAVKIADNLTSIKFSQTSIVQNAAKSPDHQILSSLFPKQLSIIIQYEKESRVSELLFVPPKPESILFITSMLHYSWPLMSTSVEEYMGSPHLQILLNRSLLYIISEPSYTSSSSSSSFSSPYSSFGLLASSSQLGSVVRQAAASALGEIAQLDSSIQQQQLAVMKSDSKLCCFSNSSTFGRVIHSLLYQMVTSNADIIDLQPNCGVDMNRSLNIQTNNNGEIELSNSLSGFETDNVFCVAAKTIGRILSISRGAKLLQFVPNLARLELLGFSSITYQYPVDQRYSSVSSIISIQDDQDNLTDDDNDETEIDIQITEKKLRRKSVKNEQKKERSVSPSMKIDINQSDQQKVNRSNEKEENMNYLLQFDENLWVDEKLFEENIIFPQKSENDSDFTNFTIPSPYNISFSVWIRQFSRQLAKYCGDEILREMADVCSISQRASEVLSLPLLLDAVDSDGENRNGVNFPVLSGLRNFFKEIIARSDQGIQSIMQQENDTKSPKLNSNITQNLFNKSENVSRNLLDGNEEVIIGSQNTLLSSNDSPVLFFSASILSPPSSSQIWSPFSPQLINIGKDQIKNPNETKNDKKNLNIQKDNSLSITQDQHNSLIYDADKQYWIDPAIVRFTVRLLQSIRENDMIHFTAQYKKISQFKLSKEHQKIHNETLQKFIQFYSGSPGMKIQPNELTLLQVLSIDSLNVARVASSVGEYSTALLFIESWCSDVTEIVQKNICNEIEELVQNNQNPATKPKRTPAKGSAVKVNTGITGLLNLENSKVFDKCKDFFDNVTSLRAHTLWREDRQFFNTISYIISSAYSHLNDPDGIDGAARCMGERAVSQHVTVALINKQWDSAIGECEIKLASAVNNWQKSKHKISNNNDYKDVNVGQNKQTIMNSFSSFSPQFHFASLSNDFSSSTITQPLLMDILQSVRHLGYSSLLRLLISSLEAENTQIPPDITEMMYGEAWKTLTTWEQPNRIKDQSENIKEIQLSQNPVESPNNQLLSAPHQLQSNVNSQFGNQSQLFTQKVQGFNSSLYEFYKGLRAQDTVEMEQALNSARNALLDEFGKDPSSAESSPAIDSLQGSAICVAELTHLLNSCTAKPQRLSYSQNGEDRNNENANLQSQSQSGKSRSKRLHSIRLWLKCAGIRSHQAMPPRSPFESVELVYSARRVALSSLGFHSEIPSQLAVVAKAARKNDLATVATKANRELLQLLGDLDSKLRTKGVTKQNIENKSIKKQNIKEDENSNSQTESEDDDSQSEDFSSQEIIDQQSKRSKKSKENENQDEEGKSKGSLFQQLYKTPQKGSKPSSQNNQDLRASNAAQQRAHIDLMRQQAQNELALCNRKQGLWGADTNPPDQPKLETIADPILRREIKALWVRTTTRLGKWLAQTKAKPAASILHEYLESAAKNADPKTDVGCRAWFRLAEYADQLYQLRMERLNSQEMKDKSANVEKYERAIRQYGIMISENEKLSNSIGAQGAAMGSSKSAQAKNIAEQKKEIERRIIQLKRKCDDNQKFIDGYKEEKKELEVEMEKFMSICLNSLVQTLTFGDKYDLQASFRLFSLWTSNWGKASANTAVAEGLQNSIPPHKFIPLAHQLCARIDFDQEMQANNERNTMRKVFGSVDYGRNDRMIKSPPPQTLVSQRKNQTNKFGKQIPEINEYQPSSQHMLNRLIFRTTIAYPHHMLLHLISAISGSQQVAQNTRTDAAKAIVLQAEEAGLQKLTADYNRCVDMYVKISLLDVDKRDSKKVKILQLPTEVLNQSQTVDTIPVITCTLHLGEIQHLHAPRIMGFNARYIIPGGMNLPKKVECLGTDGCLYTQLVKGKDDLRGDAVLQQFFGVVNAELEKGAESGKRQLHIRTYKVVPLGAQVGVIEWVGRTISFQDYLVGGEEKTSAHERYHPREKLHIDVRNQLNELVKVANDVRESAFRKSCIEFTPVFRHFFLEHFISPAEWFTRRLTYARSLATSCIVGWLVGLGDRHAQNILIDKGTGEVVHIDLGIAFEQGRQLSVPERVPFRLTRDTIDGLGVLGTEGSFRKGCEVSLRACRNARQTLLTIVEVLLHDPLYRWGELDRALQKKETHIGSNAFPHMLSMKDQRQNLQDHQEADTTNKDAERVLLRVRDKLHGISGKEAVSVEMQVNELIEEATDTGNLGLMYPGWSPWL